MELALLVVLWFLAALWPVARRLGAPDYRSMKDTELIRGYGVQKKRLAAAGRTDPDDYDATLARTGRLMTEMKRRGLIPADAFVDDHLTRGALDLVAFDKYSRSMDEVRLRSAEGDPAALYQLGVLFRMAKEQGAASGFMAKAAEAGDTDAQFAWALMLLGSQEEPEPARQHEALTWLRIAADQGHAQARLALAGLLKSLPAQIVWPALREARRRSKQAGLRLVPAAVPPAIATAPAGALLRSRVPRSLA